MCGPSQKSGWVPGSSGKKYPPSAAAAPSAATEPRFSMLDLSSAVRCSCFSSWSLVVAAPLRSLLSSRPVREENLLAETTWRVVVLVESGKRTWRRMGRWVYGFFVILPERIPAPPPPLPIVRDIIESMRVVKHSTWMDKKRGEMYVGDDPFVGPEIVIRLYRGTSCRLDSIFLQR